MLRAVYRTRTRHRGAFDGWRSLLPRDALLARAEDVFTDLTFGRRGPDPRSVGGLFYRIGIGSYTSKCRAFEATCQMTCDLTGLAAQKQRTA